MEEKLLEEERKRKLQQANTKPVIHRVIIGGILRV
jgi:hypothetical protein